MKFKFNKPFLVLIVALIFFTSCKKNTEVSGIIKTEGLKGNWQLVYTTSDSHGWFRDSLFLVMMGEMCNIYISDEGMITVYNGTTQLNMVAKWSTTIIVGHTFNIKMTWPLKSDVIYEYDVRKSMQTDNVFEFWPYVSNTFIFLNNTPMGYGNACGFCFKRISP